MDFAVRETDQHEAAAADDASRLRMRYGERENRWRPLRRRWHCLAGRPDTDIRAAIGSCATTHALTGLARSSLRER